MLGPPIGFPNAPPCSTVSNQPRKKHSKKTRPRMLNPPTATGRPGLSLKGCLRNFLSCPSGSCRRKVMPCERKGSGLKNCIPLHSIHFYKTTDPVRHNFLRLDPFPRDLDPPKRRLEKGHQPLFEQAQPPAWLQFPPPPSFFLSFPSSFLAAAASVGFPEFL